MLAETQCGEQAEGHGRDAIVVLRRPYIGAVVAATGGQAQPQRLASAKSKFMPESVKERHAWILKAPAAAKNRAAGLRCAC